MHGELQQHGRDGVQIEDIRQWSLLRQGLQRLGARDEEETRRQQDTLQSRLHVAELDPVQIQHRLAVGEYQRVQRQDLEHLQGGNQRAASLLDHVTYCNKATSHLLSLVRRLMNPPTSV